MKIIHIHPSMGGGGIEAMICALVNEMSKSNDVTLCTIYAPKKSDVFENKLSASVHRISLGKNIEGFSLKEILEIYNVIKKEILMLYISMVFSTTMHCLFIYCISM